MFLVLDFPPYAFSSQTMEGINNFIRSMMGHGINFVNVASTVPGNEGKHYLIKTFLEIL